MPAQSPIWKGTTSLVVQPESGAITLADRTQLVDVYRGPYSTALAAVLPRGTFGAHPGSRDGWVVVSSSVVKEKGNVAKLSITWEPGGPYADMPLPVEDFDLQPQELYPRVERNAFFSGISASTLNLAYGAFHGGTPEARNSNYQAINGLSDPQKTLGLNLVSKLRAGIETFYVAGARYSWWTFSYTFPSLTAGGIIESPTGPTAIIGSLPSLSWLRLIDTVAPAGVNGSMYKLTRTWLGGPSGHWDSDLYS